MLLSAAQIDEASAAVRRQWNCRPKVGIILGTGLGRFADHIDVEHEIPYARVPHFPRATADGHNGRLVCGRIGNVHVLTMDGRCHLYEGYSVAQITLPVRLMKALGVEILILSNAAGGMNPKYCSGDIMVIQDHINLMKGFSPEAVGRETWGRRDGDRRVPYCPGLVQRALAAARRADFAAHVGVYAAMTGPNYETRAEYRFLRRIGADAVGMSTVPEVIVAAHCSLRVLGLSTITNICMPDRLVPARHDDVIAAAGSAEPKVRRIILDVVADESASDGSMERPPRQSVRQVDTLLDASGTPRRVTSKKTFPGRQN